MKYGLIGEHLGHSYSCEIHGAIADYEYELKELRPDELDGFMRQRSFNAINVTIPYKQSVIPYLDEISDRARSIGAVNTVVNTGGRLYGDNTDFAGMAALAKRIGIDFKGKKVLILGTGGTSRTAHAVAESHGAATVLHVSRRGGDGLISYEDAAKKHSDAQIIINTTPVGMYPDTEKKPIDISAFPVLEGVLDAIYHPLRTNLVLDAQERGIPASGGLYMLSAQAVYASAVFLGREVEPALIEKAYSIVKADKQNIVLIGMPSCGKTTVGKIIAERTGKTFLDTDDAIVAEIGMPIADFFAQKGESAFRELESRVIAEASKKGGLVIATGGGAVLRPENVRAMRQNGAVVFIDRALEKLITTDDRPLSSSRTALEKLYETRYDIYKNAADLHADGNGTPDEVAEAILKELKL